MVKEKILHKLQLLEDILDDLKDKVSDFVNISEHSGSMRKIINECRKLLKTPPK